MIVIERPGNWLYSKKAVFVWSGHVTSGWPTKFESVIYNDDLNGVICYGHDDVAPRVLTWFIPGGSVSRFESTTPSPADARTSFKRTYGDRVVVWVNHKENAPVIQNWCMDNPVVRPEDLNIPPFEGSSQVEFQRWVDEHLDVFDDDAPRCILRQLV